MEKWKLQEKDMISHLELLSNQVTFINQHPMDNSFIPISFCINALLRHLPKGLFHSLNMKDLDTLSLDEFIGKVKPEEVFGIFKTAVQQLKLYRRMLNVCHQFLQNDIGNNDAIRKMIQCFINTFHTNPSSSNEDNLKEDLHPKQNFMPVTSPISSAKLIQTDNCVNYAQWQQGMKLSKASHSLVQNPSIGLNASIDLRKSIKEDKGDGVCILETMKRFPRDVDLQAQICAIFRRKIEKLKKKKNDGMIDAISSKQGLSIDAIVAVLDAMRSFPKHRKIQLNGLRTLSAFVGLSDQNLVIIASNGGISTIMISMIEFPDDIEAQISALTILGNPNINDDRVVRVTAESRRLVLSTMERYLKHPQIQGLGILALTNLANKQDKSLSEIVEKGGIEMIIQAMETFSQDFNIQAVGCWALGEFSKKNEEVLQIVLNAGGIPTCERARKLFPQHEKVQQNCLMALVAMERKSEHHFGINNEECLIQ